MVRKTIVNVFVCAVLACSLCATASAQSGQCVGIGTGFPYDHFPGTISCYFVGYAMYSCAYNTHCPPAAAPQETRPKCPLCGQPISLTTGNTFIEQTDLKVPGLSSGLNFARTWNSQWPTTQASFLIGSFGPNWRSTYEERIYMGSDSYVKYARSDGSFWSFGGAGSLYVVAPANVVATLAPDSGLTKWILTFQNGEQRTFSYSSGSLTSIIDRNGNVTQLTYDGLNRLVTVADPGGRHLYFSYASSSSYLVTGIASDIGISLSYSYDSQGRLIQVTKPDSSTLSFEYDSNSLITAVKDTAGKVLESHTYDSLGRGLTSSRANGVESVTVSYPQ